MKMKFDWNDISIIPEPVTFISSRNEINVLNENGMLPIFTAPMDTVVNLNNYHSYESNLIQVCLPRNLKKSTNIPNIFQSYGLDDVLNNDENKILLDIANGHMQKIFDIVKMIKYERSDVELMVGNIANPKTYKKYCEMGVDHVRVGIGGGSACFVENTLIKTKNSKVNIQDVRIGDVVLTHTCEYKKVVNIISYNTCDDLININDTISTTEHKYYVLEKKYLNENIQNYAIFLEAIKLNKEIHYLIEIINLKYKLTDITKFEIVKNKNCVVYDLTVEDNHSYVANNYIVHNCTTSANVAIHYPMASLVNECFEISKDFEKPAKIVADGGFTNYSDIIKALALGADSVMLGGIFNKAFESSGDFYIKEFEIFKKIDEEQALNYFKNNAAVYKRFRGMSTKEVQKDWNRKELRTSEGIVKYNKVEYFLKTWCENFTDYLKSAMSYSNSLNLNEFKGNAEWILISENSFKRFNK